MQSTIVYDPDTAVAGSTWNTTYNYGASGQLNSVGITDGRSRTISNYSDTCNNPPN